MHLPGYDGRNAAIAGLTRNGRYEHVRAIAEKFNSALIYTEMACEAFRMQGVELDPYQNWSTALSAPENSD
jgi:hypothetical protein